jgi:hypothetical protein
VVEEAIGAGGGSGVVVVVVGIEQVVAIAGR